MDRQFANGCFAEPIAVPAGLQGIDRAFRASGSHMAPAVNEGDVLCCYELAAPPERWPALAVLTFPWGYSKIVTQRPGGEPLYTVSVVRFIMWR